MAEALRHLIKRGAAYWARRAVPRDLQPIIGMTQLRVPLASKRRIAERASRGRRGQPNEILCLR